MSKIIIYKILIYYSLRGQACILMPLSLLYCLKNALTTAILLFITIISWTTYHPVKLVIVTGLTETSFLGFMFSVPVDAEVIHWKL